MFWLYLTLLLLIVSPSVLTGFGGFQGGWEIWGATQVVVPVIWVIASAASIQLAPRPRSGWKKVFIYTFAVALTLIGAAFGEALGLFSGIAFNYGASETDLATGYVQFFLLGAAVAVVPSALIGGVAVLLVKIFAQSPPATSHSQGN